MKIIFIFSKDLSSKSCWRLITRGNLWTQVIIQKYIYRGSILEWIINEKKKKFMCSIMWKEVIHSFEVVGEGLAWCIGNGSKVHIGSHPWLGSGDSHNLP